MSVPTPSEQGQKGPRPTELRGGRVLWQRQSAQNAAGRTPVVREDDGREDDSRVPSLRVSL